MAKRRKMDWYDLLSRGLQWIDYAENVYNKPSNTSGTMYHMAKSLSKEDKDFILGWDNTLVTTCRLKNALEIEIDCVFIADRSIR